MPPAAIAAIAPIAAAGLSAGIAAATRPKPQQAPQLSEDRKKTLGSFAERLAGENKNVGIASREGLVFGPNSRPIQFSPFRPNRPGPINFNS